LWAFLGSLSELDPSVASQSHSRLFGSSSRDPRTQTVGTNANNQACYPKSQVFDVYP
jgi:hypothetical protein